MEPDLQNQELIVIIGVEISEVCVGIGLPGKLWVEVLVSFLQNQIIFVEGLWIKWRGESERSQYGLVCDTWMK